MFRLKYLKNDFIFIWKFLNRVSYAIGGIHQLIYFKIPFDVDLNCLIFLNRDYLYTWGSSHIFSIFCWMEEHWYRFEVPCKSCTWLHKACPRMRKVTAVFRAKNKKFTQEWTACHLAIPDFLLLLFKILCHFSSFKGSIWTFCSSYLISGICHSIISVQGDLKQTNKCSFS